MAFIQFNNIKGDIFGGITAGIVSLPLALAFGIQAFGGINDPAAASMGALAGLVGATLLGFFAALFGGTHSQISGPTGPMTVVTASIVSAAWTASSGNFSAVIIAMAMAGMRTIPDIVWYNKDRQVCALYPLPCAIRIYEWYWCNHHLATDISTRRQEITSLHPRHAS